MKKYPEEDEHNKMDDIIKEFERIILKHKQKLPEDFESDSL